MQSFHDCTVREVRAQHDNVKSVKYIGTRDYYDLHVPGAEHYALAGLWHHNTGKTTGVLTFLVNACYLWPGTRVLLARATRTSMTDSVLTTLEEEVLGVTHPAVLGGSQRKDRSQYELNGSVIVAGGLDHPERLFSTAWDFIYVNEATEISLDQWELFGRSQRQRRQVKGSAGSPFRLRIADCNPGPPGHWLNRRATPCPDSLRRTGRRTEYNTLQRYNCGPQDAPMHRLVSVHQDNPGYWEWWDASSRTGWRWTPAGEDMLRGLQSMTGHRRARMLEGRWVAAEGSVYPEFSEDKHVVTPFEVPSDWPIYWWYDSGYDHPTGIIWLAVAPNGCLYIIGDHRVRGQGVEWHAKQTIKRERDAGWIIDRRYGDPQTVFSQTAQSPKTLAAQWSAFGIRIAPGPRSTDPERMVESVRTRLLAGTLKVFSTCRATIDEFQSWRFKRNSKGEILKGDDQYEDANNDLLDGVRGLCSVQLSRQRGVGVTIVDEV